VPTLLRPTRLAAPGFTALASAATVAYLALKSSARAPGLFFASLLMCPQAGLTA
jgi:hypothetical protein